jgi:hypothetical protein
MKCVDEIPPSLLSSYKSKELPIVSDLDAAVNFKIKQVNNNVGLITELVKINYYLDLHAVMIPVNLKWNGIFVAGLSPISSLANNRQGTIVLWVTLDENSDEYYQMRLTTVNLLNKVQVISSKLYAAELKGTNEGYLIMKAFESFDFALFSILKDKLSEFRAKYIGY